MPNTKWSLLSDNTIFIFSFLYAIIYHPKWGILKSKSKFRGIPKAETSVWRDQGFLLCSAGMSLRIRSHWRLFGRLSRYPSLCHGNDSECYSWFQGRSIMLPLKTFLFFPNLHLYLSVTSSYHVQSFILSDPIALFILFTLLQRSYLS